jgi:hypothetical protein
MDQSRSPYDVAAVAAPEIDFAILADRAEVLNNKLYVMGGAWDATFVVNFRQPCFICLAVGVLIPWNSANITHELTMKIESADAQQIMPELRTTVTAGRPPTAIVGQSFRTLLTINAQVILPGPGAYVALIQIAHGPIKRVVFYANQAPSFGPPFSAPGMPRP